MDTPAEESGSAAVSNAWQEETELALREVEQLADDFSPATLDARAAVTTGEGLIREVGKIWQRLTKNSTLREHAVWKSGLNVYLADEEQLLDHFDSPRCRVWREREEALVTRGRDILGRFISETRSASTPDTRNSRGRTSSSPCVSA